MTCLYKEVAKERGYNKLNRMHYQLLEWNCNKWTKTVMHFYAEPIDAGKDSKADKWFKSLLDKEELFDYMWAEIDPEDYVDPPKFWIPINEKYQIEGESERKNIKRRK